MRRDDLWEEIKEEEDVGQKRYLMYRLFEQLIQKVYEDRGIEVPEPKERVKGLQENEGYVYKLSQDFLTSSSTLEKERKLEKIKDFLSGREE